MNHQERWTACRAISDRLLKKYAHDVIATAVTGSVGRGDDAEFSDIDFSVLVRKSRAYIPIVSSSKVACFPLPLVLSAAG